MMPVGFRALIAALYDDFHPRNLRLFVNTPVGDPDWDLKFIADHSDGLLVMNYDEHNGDEPGPIASQDWFIDNLKTVIKQWEEKALDLSRRIADFDKLKSASDRTRRA